MNAHINVTEKSTITLEISFLCQARLILSKRLLFKKS